ncbi:hypothetical protein NPIL_560331, partial [Nephila pilipes]
MESTDPENDLAVEELETMERELDGIDGQNSRNLDACPIKTRLEEKFRGAINYFHYHSA